MTGLIGGWIATAPDIYVTLRTDFCYVSSGLAYDEVGGVTR